MNIQTELLENSIARMTVQIPPQLLEDAQKRAAVELSKKVRIPGFRPGKAPYNIVVKMLGGAAILEEAVDMLVNEVYPKALRQTDLEPYDSGTVEAFDVETLTFKFLLPVQPTVDLGDYLNIRVEGGDAEPITDEKLDELLQQLRREHAKSEPVEGEIAEGMTVTVTIYGEFADGEERPEGEEAEGQEGEQAVPPVYKGDGFIHENGHKVTLNGKDDSVLPGFAEKLAGHKAGDTVTFEMVLPQEDRFEGVVGRTVKFDVEIESVSQDTLPELNDDFAAELTKDEANPLTLEQLRARIHRNMTERAEMDALDAYAEKVLNAIAEQGKLSYPEKMLDERAEEMYKSYAQRMKAGGISMDIYFQITGMTREGMLAQMREDARSPFEHSLIVSELVERHNLHLEPSEIDAEIEVMLSDVDDEGERQRVYAELTSAKGRRDVANQVFNRKVLTFLRRLGKGEVTAPEPKQESTPSDTGSDEG